MTASVAVPGPVERFDHGDDFLGHPKGVYVCFFTEMWERFSFYGMKALLLLYLMQHHRFSNGEGLDVLGAYGGLVYALPVIGGMLADRWLGLRKSVVFGGLLLILGHTGMAVEGHAATLVNGVVVRDTAALRVLYLSLALIIMGVGFLKPNVSTIVGKLYDQDDPRRDSGFSLFYAGINVGALFASIVCGYLGQTLGWSWGFGAAGIGMVLGQAQFLLGQKYLRGHAEPPDPALLSERVFGVPREWLIYAGAVAALLPVAWLMYSVTAIKVTPWLVTGLLLLALAVLVAMVWAAWSAFRRNSAQPPALSAMWPSMLVASLAGIAIAWVADAKGVTEYFHQNTTLALVLMALVFLGFGVWYVGFVVRRCSGVEGQQMSALMALIFMCLVFFTMYEQTYGSWVTFTDLLLTKDIAPSLVQAVPEIHFGSDVGANLALFIQYAPWSIVSLLLAPLSFVIAARLSDRNAASKLPAWLFGGAFALMLVLFIRDSVVLPQTAGSLTYLGAIFLVLLAPLFTWIWGFLDRYGMDPSKPIKSALGLLFAGLSFIPLAIAAQHAGATGAMASVWWLVLAYFVLELGEMCLAPVGLSAVTQLSVARVASLMMGTWFLATAFSETLAALFGKLAAIDVPEGTKLDFASASATYAHLFWLMMVIGVGFAVAAFACAPILRRMMHGVK
jgi:POT family proton-dependent oligopeptide transporter